MIGPWALRRCQQVKGVGGEGKFQKHGKKQEGGRPRGWGGGGAR